MALLLTIIEKIFQTNSNFHSKKGTTEILISIFYEFFAIGKKSFWEGRLSTRLYFYEV